MKAIRVYRFGPPSVLQLEEVALPVPGPGEARELAAHLNLARVLEPLAARAGTLPASGQPGEARPHPMRCARRPALYLALMLVLAAPGICLASPPSPTFFLARERSALIVARLTDVATLSLDLAHRGDPMPVQRLTAHIETVLAQHAGPPLVAGQTIEVSQQDPVYWKACQYHPALSGRRYVMWIDNASKAVRAATGTRWLSEYGGVLPLTHDNRVLREHSSCTLDAFIAALHETRDFTVDRIKDPSVRLAVILRRIRSHRYSSPNSSGLRPPTGASAASLAATLRGLNAILLDPTQQAELVKPAPPTPNVPIPSFATSQTMNSRALYTETLQALEELCAVPALRHSVLTALHPDLRAAPVDVRNGIAIFLGIHGDPAGKLLLEALLSSPDQEMEVDPRSVSQTGDNPADNDCHTAAAFALARIGDPIGLHSARPAVILAAIEGLGPSQAKAGCAAARRLLHRHPHPSEPEVPALAPRCLAALARLGDDSSLAKLVTWWLDACKNPGQSSATPETLRVSLETVAPTKHALLARLGVLSHRPKLWDDPLFAAYRKMLESPANSTRPPSARETLKIRSMLMSDDARTRLHALVYIAHHRLNSCLDLLTRLAQTGSMEERVATLGVIMRLDTPPSPSFVRSMLTTGTLETRLVALDLASGRYGTMFAPEALRLTRKAAGDVAAVGQLPYLLARLASGPTIPPSFTAGLDDTNPLVAYWYVKAAVLSGNPALVPLLRPLEDSVHPEVARLARWGCLHLPWK